MRDDHHKPSPEAAERTQMPVIGGGISIGFAKCPTPALVCELWQDVT